MRRLNAEDGSAIVLVGIFMAMLLVTVALVADSGRLYDERGQLQHGADAAALAIAFDCARDDTACDATATAVAQEYLDANAEDATSALDPGSPLPLNPFIDFPERAVTVDALSLQPGQSPSEGAVSLSLQRSDGTSTAPVRARAIATWGSLASADTLPITFSMCDFYAALGWDPVNGEVPDDLYPSDPVTIDFQDSTSGDDGCDAQAGHDSDGDGSLPGGFGALETIDQCTARTTAIDPDDPDDPDTWAYQDPGADFNEIKEDCLAVGHVYALPIFVDVCRKTDGSCPAGVEPTQAAYGIGGYAMFELLGWRFPGYASSPKPTCGGSGGSGSCIRGRFVVDVVPAGGELGPVLEDFGARTAKIIG